MYVCLYVCIYICIARISIFVLSVRTRMHVSIYVYVCIDMSVCSITRSRHVRLPVHGASGWRWKIIKRARENRTTVRTGAGQEEGGTPTCIVRPRHVRVCIMEYECFLYAPHPFASPARPPTDGSIVVGGRESRPRQIVLRSPLRVVVVVGLAPVPSGKPYTTRVRRKTFYFRAIIKTRMHVPAGERGRSSNIVPACGGEPTRKEEYARPIVFAITGPVPLWPRARPVPHVWTAPVSPGSWYGDNKTRSFSGSVVRFPRTPVGYSRRPVSGGDVRSKHGSYNTRPGWTRDSNGPPRGTFPTHRTHTFCWWGKKIADISNVALPC